MMKDFSQEQMEEKGLIAFFRSEYFVLITFVTAITPLMAHTAGLLLKVSDIQSKWYANFFAFSFDLAVFAFSINGRRAQAIGLALIVFVLNVCFFNLDTLSELAGNQQLVRLFVTVVISGAASWIVHSYVVFFNEKIGERKAVQKMAEHYRKQLQIGSEQLLKKQKELDDLNGLLKKYEERILVLEAQVNRLTDYKYRKSMPTVDLVNLVEHRVVLFPFTCKMCEQTALTQKSLEGMVSYCKHATCKYRIPESLDIAEYETINP